jgi:hypothetical protein
MLCIIWKEGNVLEKEAFEEGTTTEAESEGTDASPAVEEDNASDYPYFLDVF